MRKRPIQLSVRERQVLRLLLNAKGTGELELSALELQRRVRVSDRAIRQILEVLVDNLLIHEQTIAAWDVVYEITNFGTKVLDDQRLLRDVFELCYRRAKEATRAA
jgi:hypothetical protein